MLDDPLLAPRISATLFVDPVTLLLHMPDVAYNFTIRAPKATNEWVLWYFASKDPGVAHTLGRHFFLDRECALAGSYRRTRWKGYEIDC